MYIGTVYELHEVLVEMHFSVDHLVVTSCSRRGSCSARLRNVKNWTVSILSNCITVEKVRKREKDELSRSLTGNALKWPVTATLNNKTARNDRLPLISLELSLNKVQGNVGPCSSEEIIKALRLEQLSLHIFNKIIASNEDCLVITQNIINRWKDI